MRLNRLVLLTVIGAALTLGGTVALAQTIDCPGGNCFGTDQNDILNGTAGEDFISGLGAADEITGRGSNDTLIGDGQFDYDLDGADTIAGGGGEDIIYGKGGADRLLGGPGNDRIRAQENEFVGEGHPAGKDTVKGGRGNDDIYAKDGVKDTIDCGPGVDSVVFDKTLDVVTNCENKAAVPVE
jgi:hypothetical protein